MQSKNVSEEAHIVSLVENAGSIVISLVLQIIIFGDIPNTVKIIGAILTVTSIIIIGLQKIFKARGMSAIPEILRFRNYEERNHARKPRSRQSSEDDFWAQTIKVKFFATIMSDFKMKWSNRNFLSHSFKMFILLVASMLYFSCQAHHLGHRRGEHTENKMTKGLPPICSKTSCEKINTIGLDPFRNFPAPAMPWRQLIDPRVLYAYKIWSVDHKSAWGPTKNCTSEPIDSLGGGQVGLTKNNEIVHLFVVQMFHDCISTKKDCDNIFFNGNCLYSSNNLITINQSGVVIDDDVLGKKQDEYDWDAYDNISCLSCWNIKFSSVIKCSRKHVPGGTDSLSFWRSQKYVDWPRMPTSLKNKEFN